MRFCVADGYVRRVELGYKAQGTVSTDRSRNLKTPFVWEASCVVNRGGENRPPAVPNEKIIYH